MVFEKRTTEEEPGFEQSHRRSVGGGIFPVAVREKKLRKQFEISRTNSSVIEDESSIDHELISYAVVNLKDKEHPFNSSITFSIQKKEEKASKTHTTTF